MALLEVLDPGGALTAHPVKPPRHRLAWTTLITVGVAATIAVLVASNVIGLAGWRGGADQAAASTLNEASLNALAARDLTVPPGEYLRVSTDAVNGVINGSDDGEKWIYLRSRHFDLYIPSDTSGTWVWERDAGQVAQVFDPKYQAFAEKDVAAAEGYEIWRGEAGRFGETSRPAYDWESLPRDPHQLLNQIYARTLTAGPSRDGEALVWIADALRTGTVPADMRAALYQAAAGIPGVSVTDHQANLNGRVGVAIGRDEGQDGYRQDIIIDPKTGDFIGEREVSLHAFGGAPIGTVVSWTAVSATVSPSSP